MNKISSFAVVLSIATSLIASAPATAGLGDADSGETRNFDAWCNKEGNKCKVKFTDERMSVASDGIDRTQFRGFSYRYQYEPQYNPTPRHNFVVNYQEDGVYKSGTFIFIHQGAAMKFHDTLNWFCGESCREKGPSIEVR